MTDMQIYIRKATLKDYPQVLGILTKVGLPIEGVAEQLKHFFVAETHGNLIGVCGVHVSRSKGLLRSLAVVNAFRNQGVGRRLFEACLQQAKELGLDELYVLTQDRQSFFTKLGFEQIERTAVPDYMQSMRGFAELCHDADCLRFPVSLPHS